MGNPLVLTTAVTALSSDEGQKAIGQTANALKVLVVTAGIYFTGKFAIKKLKEVRARNFANENAGHPDLTAASVIFKSFKRFSFPGFLGFLLPTFDISTDESALNNIARKVTNVKSVSDAYRILYDRNLFQDVTGGLDTEELQTFWNFINSPSQNLDVKTTYPIGSVLYAAVKKGITVNIAEQDVDNTWKGTNKLYKKIQGGEVVGEIVSLGIWSHEEGRQENYYIVKDCWNNAWDWNCKYGVVFQHQVTNEKP